jgi:hypothetical protein
MMDGLSNPSRPAANGIVPVAANSAPMLDLRTRLGKAAGRLAPRVYSSQFHPEFSTDFMREHLQHHAGDYARKGHDTSALVNGLYATPHAAGLLRRFLERVVPR